jgi:hypothetical protein
MATVAPGWRGTQRTHWSRRAAAVPAFTWAVGLYLAISVVAIGHGVLANPVGGCACGASGNDPSAAMWSLAWWPYALLHGLDPFYTHAVWAPHGVSVAAAATIPAAAFALWPITATFGPLAAYNVLAIASPVLCGLTAFLLCRRLVARSGPALFGGLLFAFGGYQLSQLQSHLNLTLVFMLPLLALLVVRRFADDLRGRRFVIVMALALIVQALLSTEILFDACLVGLLGTVVGLVVFEGPERSRLVHVSLETALAGALAALVLAPYLIAALSQPPVARLGNLYGLDALNLVIPTPVNWLGGQLFHGVSATFEAGNSAEADGYLGLPLLAIAAWFAATCWRSRREARVLVVLLALVIVLALGSPLRIAGNSVVPLPWRSLEALPLFQNIVASRLMVFADLIAAVVAAMWLAGRSRRPTLRFLLAALSVAALLPDIPGDWWSSQPPNPRLFSAGLEQHYLSRGANVLVVPVAWLGDSMLWQAENGFSFSMPIGYLSSASPTSPVASAGLSWIFEGSITAGRIPIHYAAAIAAYLHGHGIRQILIAPAYQPKWSAVLPRIAGRVTRAGGMLLYTVDGAAQRA